MQRALRLGLAAVLVAVGSAGSAPALVINNGLAPPDPANVVDASDGLTGTDSVYVLNTGCSPPIAPLGGTTCVAPLGAPTAAEVASGVAFDTLWVGGTSTASVQPGAQLYAVTALDAATVTVNATVGEASARGSSTLVFAGFTHRGVSAGESAHVELRGTAAGGVSVSGDASLHVTGGRGWDDVGITVRDQAYFDMSGGEHFRRITLRSTTPATLRGGTIKNIFGTLVDVGAESQLDWSGGVIPISAMLDVSGIVRIFGSDFRLNGVPVGFGSYSTATPNHITQIQGTLESGETFSVPFRTRGTGALVLVPEPASGTLAMLGVGALALRARRSRAEVRA